MGRWAGLLVAGVVLTTPLRARADLAPPTLFAPTESAVPPEGPATAARPPIMPFGPSPAPRVVLFPVMRIVRPADIPPPKPTKGLALVFDW